MRERFLRRDCVQICGRAVGGLVLTFLAGAEFAQAQLNQLLTRVPNSANAIVVVHADAVLSTPMAKNGNWQQERRRASQAGLVTVPPTTEWFVIAAEMDYEYMQPLWEIAAAYMTRPPAMKEVAQRTGGRLDRLAGTDAVERPNDSYVVSFGPRVVGAMSPANRQHVIRWVRESRSRKQPDLSPYLATAAEAASRPNNQIVVAFDLADLLAPEEIAHALANSKALQDAAVDVQQAAQVLAKLRGVRLEIEVNQTPRGRLHATFDTDPSFLTGVASSLLAEILADRGARIDGIAPWSARSTSDSIILEGELSASAVRRVLTVLTGPVGPWESAAASDVSPGDPTADLSRNYFQAVTGYLNDLFVNNSLEQIRSLDQMGMWVERYARKIEGLDTTGVDSDAVSFGVDVVMGLREIGAVLQRAERRSDIQQATMFNSGRSRYGQYGAYGYFEKGNVTRERNAIQADETLRGVRSSAVIVDELRTLSAKTRQLLSQRYQIDF
jgi:2-phospho-L-lactate guanylyltransferase (CobY/MobA/RfbA family)